MGLVDVEGFTRQHGSCGTLTASTSSPTRSGSILTLTCACGATYERWVTAEEMKEGLSLLPSAPSSEPDTAPPIPTLPPAPTDRKLLEKAMAAALEALDAPARTPPAPPAPVAPIEQVTPPLAARKPRPAAGSAPDKQALENTLRTTLEAFDAESEMRTAPRRPAPQPGAIVRDISPIPALTRQRVVIGSVVAVVAVILAVGTWYALRGDQSVARVAAPAPPPAPRLRAPENERPAITQAVGALRDLQSFSKPDLQFRMYFNRVAFAKADVDRYLQTAKDSDVKTSLREAMALHNLAAAAWRAKTLNEPAKWEAVGDDPAIELCPPVKRLLTLGEEPPNTTRNQWRGIALAAGVPLLWDCAGERLAEVERALK
jgi:hypothetical protein